MPPALPRTLVSTAHRRGFTLDLPGGYEHVYFRSLYSRG